MVHREDVIDRATLTAYISYARKTIHPKLTDAAVQELIQAYTGNVPPPLHCTVCWWMAYSQGAARGRSLVMRADGLSRKTISATPRQLESLIRLSEAHARCRFSRTVELFDVQEAVRYAHPPAQSLRWWSIVHSHPAPCASRRLMKVALLQAATNPKTGLVDMDAITTGMGASKRGLVARVAQEARTMLSATTTVSIKFAKALADLSSAMNEVRRCSSPFA